MLPSASDSSTADKDRAAAKIQALMRGRAARLAARTLTWKQPGKQAASAPELNVDAMKRRKALSVIGEATYKGAKSAKLNLHLKGGARKVSSKTVVGSGEALLETGAQVVDSGVQVIEGAKRMASNFVNQAEREVAVYRERDFSTEGESAEEKHTKRVGVPGTPSRVL